MTRVGIIGGAGRMGQAIAGCLLDNLVPGLQLSCSVDLATNPAQGQDLGVLAGRGPCGVALSSSLPDAMELADVFIDFSFHTGVKERLEILKAAGKSVVIGTTGLSVEEQAEVEAAAREIPVLFAPNMSLGVNLLANLVEQAARTLKDKGYDIEITEMHHRMKKDAPSGTALFLGEAAAKGSDWVLPEVQKDGRSGIEGERPAKEIGFHALRGGDVVGDHTVRFAADGELIDLSHRATRRETFAIGALRAADWLSDKSAGRVYSMKDVLGLD
ncbi:4-hydroxy-tetrahydrodipicolinate reductase [Kiritimatiellaeota bacterium B1221]|nr:4-hydroxy-tetrahydrodipicolinate reductase [Kiritimatiellaeota bacterium B1221]